MTTSTSTFCPLDDRYSESLKEIQYGGEFGFMKFRLEIEIKYFLEIVKIKKSFKSRRGRRIKLTKQERKRQRLIKKRLRTQLGIA